MEGQESREDESGKAVKESKRGEEEGEVERGEGPGKTIKVRGKMGRGRGREGGGV